MQIWHGIDQNGYAYAGHMQVVRRLHDASHRHDRQ